MERYASPIHGTPMSAPAITPLIGVLTAVMVLFIVRMPSDSRAMPVDTPWTGCILCRSGPCDFPAPSSLRVTAAGEMLLDGTPVQPSALDAALAAEEGHGHAAFHVALHIDDEATLEDAARAIAIVQRNGTRMVFDTWGDYVPRTGI